MGIGELNTFKSDSVEYSTPLSLFIPIKKEFDLKIDVCANDENYKLEKYWTCREDAFVQEWNENSWMNPPYNNDLKKWVRKAYKESIKYRKVTIVCLIPVRSNTKWWSEVVNKAEVRFIIGEVNFSNLKRGLWLPLCFLIFGNKSKPGRFGCVYYNKNLSNFII
jgi:phage N-6-adenine-methyltransferase